MKELLGAIALALNLDATEFEAALKDGDSALEGEALTAKVSEVMKARISALKTEQLGRGTREANKAFEKAIKNAGFTPEGDLKGVELLNAYMQAQVHTQPTDNQITRENAASNPVVKELIAEAKRAAGQAYESLKAEYDTFKQSATHEKVAAQVRSRIPDVLKAANVRLEVEGVDTKARVDALMNMIDMKRVAHKDGDLFFADPDGGIETNDFGKPKKVDDFIVSIAKGLYGTATQSPANGGANPSNPAGGAPSGSTIKFASADDFNKFMTTSTDATARQQAAAAWAEQLQSKEPV